MLILSNGFNVQSGSHHSHRSGSHNICSLGVFANSSHGHHVALGLVLRLFCPVLTFQSFETCHTRQFLWDDSSDSILKQLRLHYFFQNSASVLRINLHSTSEQFYPLPIFTISSNIISKGEKHIKHV